MSGNTMNILYWYCGILSCDWQAASIIVVPLCERSVYDTWHRFPGMAKLLLRKFAMEGVSEATHNFHRSGMHDSSWIIGAVRRPPLWGPFRTPATLCNPTNPLSPNAHIGSADLCAWVSRYCPLFFIMNPWRLTLCRQRYHIPGESQMELSAGLAHWHWQPRRRFIPDSHFQNIYKNISRLISLHTSM